MKLYLIRHGDAVSEKVDPAKPLSAQGAEHVERVAAHLAGLGIRVNTVWHSGKKRAEQTARIIARAVNPSGGFDLHGGLQPLDTVDPIVQELSGLKDDVFIAGHLPFLGNLAGTLLTGQSEKSFLVFGGACVACLERDNGTWRLRWMIRPEMVD